ncbi:MAG: N-formylglutamate amidohydrolase [Pseudomonadota bacterium]
MPLQVVHGNSPVIICLPYTGTNMQRSIVQRLRDRDHWLTAPDRYLDKVIGGLSGEMNLVRANFHRFLSDVEQQVNGTEPMTRKGMIGVVPLLDQDGQNIWAYPPEAREAASWRSIYFAPYHAAVAQIAQVRARFGHAVLVTCRARRDTPFGDPGKKPDDIAIRTFIGASSAIDLPVKMQALLQSSDQFTNSLSGQLGVGSSTRRYGRPGHGVHALDLEISEATYLNTQHDALQLDAAKVDVLRETLAETFDLIANWRPD